MRVPPLLKVEVDGQVELRPGVLDVLGCSVTGTPTIARMRPQLLPGEILRERLGRIPEVIRTE